MRTALIHMRLHDGDLVRGLVYGTIVSANLAHVSNAVLEAELAGGAGQAPDDARRRRPVSAHAIAQSLNLPYETVRTRVVKLIELGLCERRSGGLVAPPGIGARPELQEATSQIYAVFCDVIRALNGLGFDFEGLAVRAGAWPPDPAGAPSPSVVARVVLDFEVRHLTSLVPSFGDVLGSLIFAGVLQANTRSLLASPNEAWAYARQTTPPPDELRTPVSIRHLARDLDMPYETVRRHTAALTARGYLKMIPGKGVLAPAAILGDDGLGRENPPLMQRFTRMVAELTRLGFDFADPK